MQVGKIPVDFWTNILNMLLPETYSYVEHTAGIPLPKFRQIKAAAHPTVLVLHVPWKIKFPKA